MPERRLNGLAPPAQSGAETRNSLVLIRPGRNKSPLFLVHDGQGETMLYLNLARRLDQDRAVYGLQPCGHANSPIIHTRTSEMAAYHLGKIRSVQPQGPYLLGGLCVGGVIAFEIARQLQAEGETVALVALLDAPDVAAKSKRWRFARERLRSFSTALESEGSIGFTARALAVAASCLRKAKNLTAFVAGERIGSLRDSVRIRLLRFFTDRRLRLPRLAQGLPVQTVCLFAEKQYRPKSPYSGELVLFKATVGQDADEPFAERFDDPQFGWGRRSTEGVKVIDVPGGHFSMLQEPHVRVLADQFNQYIARALDREALKPTRTAVDPRSSEASPTAREAVHPSSRPSPTGPPRPFSVPATAQAPDPYERGT